MTRRTLEQRYEDSARETEALRKQVLQRKMRQEDGYMKSLCAAEASATRLSEQTRVPTEVSMQCVILIAAIREEKERLTHVPNAQE